jgi:hypothetical protein
VTRLHAYRLLLEPPQVQNGAILPSASIAIEMLAEELVLRFWFPMRRWDEKRRFGKRQGS